MKKRETRREGFTYLELIVVISLLAVLTAIIVPVYGDSVSAMKRRSARGGFVALLYFVQELSVRESREVRLYMDEGAGTYWVEGWISGHGDAKRFEPIPDRDYGGIRYFPEQLRIERIRARSDRGRDLYYIACFPNGASDRAEIQLSGGADGDGSTTIATMGGLGQIEVTP